jgi:hypothetical protein
VAARIEERPDLLVRASYYNDRLAGDDAFYVIADLGYLLQSARYEPGTREDPLDLQPEELGVQVALLGNREVPQTPTVRNL